MLEDAEDLIAGCQLLMKFIGLDEGYIGIEENKPDAIEHLDKLIAAKGITIITIMPRTIPRKVFRSFLSVNMATAIFLSAAATVALITDLRLCQTGRPYNLER